MTRGESQQLKVHYKGKEDDFLVFVDDEATYKKWKTDKSVAMAHFISSFKIFVTHRYVLMLPLCLSPSATLGRPFLPVHWVTGTGLRRGCGPREVAASPITAGRVCGQRSCRRTTGLGLPACTRQ